MKKKQCGLKNCGNILGPGAAAVGFMNPEKKSGKDEVRVCSHHAWTIMTLPRGTFVITPKKELKLLPAKPTIIT